MTLEMGRENANFTKAKPCNGASQTLTLFTAKVSQKTLPPRGCGLLVNGARVVTVPAHSIYGVLAAKCACMSLNFPYGAAG